MTEQSPPAPPFRRVALYTLELTPSGSWHGLERPQGLGPDISHRHGRRVPEDHRGSTLKSSKGSLREMHHSSGLTS